MGSNGGGAGCGAACSDSYRTCRPATGSGDPAIGLSAALHAFDIGGEIRIGGERLVDEAVENRQPRLAGAARQHEQHAARRLGVVGRADTQVQRPWTPAGAIEGHVERRARVAGDAGTRR